MPKKKKPYSMSAVARRILGDGDWKSRYERMDAFIAAMAERHDQAMERLKKYEASDRKTSAAMEKLHKQMMEQHKRAMERMDKYEDGDRKTRKRIEEAEEARGRAAEAMFRGALPDLLKKAGMKVNHVEPRRLRKLDREYDFVARNGKANFVGEVKVRFRARDLAQLRSLLLKFREDYPEKAGKRAVYGIVCGLVVDEDAADIARGEGLLVVEGKGKINLRAKPRKMRNYGAK